MFRYPVYTRTFPLDFALTFHPSSITLCIKCLLSAHLQLAPSAFALGSQLIGTLEGGAIGLKRSNIAQSVGNYSFMLCIQMLLVDTVLYALLAWYLDQVLPTEFGVPLPVYFPLLPSYWLGEGAAVGQGLGWNFGAGRRIFVDACSRTSNCHRNNGASNAVNAPKLSDFEAVEDEEAQGAATLNGGPKVEAADNDLLKQLHEGRAVAIRGLRKVYKSFSDQKVVVEGLDLDLFENQVTVLLGHNGEVASMKLILAFPSGSLSLSVCPLPVDCNIFQRVIVSLKCQVLENLRPLACWWAW